jgi:hypothetical protein
MSINIDRQRERSKRPQYEASASLRPEIARMPDLGTSTTQWGADDIRAARGG